MILYLTRLVKHDTGVGSVIHGDDGILCSAVERPYFPSVGGSEMWKRCVPAGDYFVEPASANGMNWFKLVDCPARPRYSCAAMLGGSAPTYYDNLDVSIAIGALVRIHSGMLQIPSGGPEAFNRILRACGGRRFTLAVRWANLSSKDPRFTPVAERGAPIAQPNDVPEGIVRFAPPNEGDDEGDIFDEVDEVTEDTEEEPAF